MATDLPAGETSTCEHVLQVEWWSEALFCLTITRPSAYRFTPGQFSRLGLADPERPETVVWRAYSVTSGMADPHLEYYGITVPGGQFTSAVKQLRLGDPILLEREPNGFLTIDRFTEGDDLWMLSTGTGLGPFVAILRDTAVWRRFRRLVLVHCVRHADELAYAATLRQLAQMAQADPQAATLQLVQSVTREPARSLVSRGTVETPEGVRLHARIPVMIADGTLEAAAGMPLDPDTARLMLCGNPAMIEATRRLLQSRGFRPVRRALPGHFLTENYW